MSEQSPMRVCVIGAGMRFLGGISYHTLHVSNTLACSHDVSAILMRQLLPTRFYPGHKRVGANITPLEYDPKVRVFNGVDWYWLPSMLRAIIFLMREHPDIVLFQWWSGTVLHSYLLLALVARLLRSQVVIEFHEVQDPGEAEMRLAHAYMRLVAPLVVSLAHGFVVHSENDEKLLQSHYKLKQRPVTVAPVASLLHSQAANSGQKHRAAPASCCNLLFFGLIRPYKGLDDLIRAFDALPENEIVNYWLTIVGETWEGWTEPAELIAQSHYRDRITFVNHYVTDDEAAQFFAEADAVVLPYHRGSASGPLHIAMNFGLPVVVTRVGGLGEAVSAYEGAVVVPPEDPVALQNGLLKIAKFTGKRYMNPHSWEYAAGCYHALFEAIRSTSEEKAQQPMIEDGKREERREPSVF
jgi:glycosyltransferase involved in cell wall biosynthesis